MTAYRCVLPAASAMVCGECGGVGELLCSRCVSNVYIAAQYSTALPLYLTAACIVLSVEQVPEGDLLLVTMSETAVACA